MSEPRSLDSMVNEMINLCEIRGEMDDATNQNIEKRIAYLEGLMETMTIVKRDCL